MNTPKILLVVTGTGTYADKKLPTGLWLSECTHLYHRARQLGCEITVASPHGGNTPVDPESLKPFTLDRLSKECRSNPAFQRMLQRAKSLDEVSEMQFDCVYLAGGHGAMYDFPENIPLQRIIKTHYKEGRIVAAICHGVSGLLNVELASGDYLIAGKRLTGFSWFEESLARRKKKVPFNLEAALIKRGADYRKAWLPMTSKVIVDGALITGQNPFSSKEMAETVMRQLNKR